MRVGCTSRFPAATPARPATRTSSIPWFPFSRDRATPLAHSILELHAAAAEGDILATLANGTGGTFFHNNNDMDEGLRRLSEAPEDYYILGFTPQNLKTDGKFHTLKVSSEAPSEIRSAGPPWLLCSQSQGGRRRRGETRD